MFCDIKVLQDLFSHKGMVSLIYLKVDDPKNVRAVIASMKQGTLEDYNIYAMEDYMALFSPDKVPYLSQFIAVIIGISVVISFAVVALSMYMGRVAADARDRDSESHRRVALLYPDADCGRISGGWIRRNRARHFVQLRHAGAAACFGAVFFASGHCLRMVAQSGGNRSGRRAVGRSIPRSERRAARPDRGPRL